MPPDETTTTIVDDDARGNAEFGSGFTGKDAEPPAKAGTPDPATIVQEKEPAPKYVQLTEDQFASLTAAAADVSSLKKQQSHNFGQIGNLQKLLNEMREKKETDTAQLSSAAFDNLKKEFPELADMTKEAVHNELAQIRNTGSSDDERFTRMLAERDAKAAERELKSLEHARPNWRQIVGAVGVGETPDPEQPYRKWLATKSPEYQAHINESTSALDLDRSITLFQRETKAPIKPSPAPRADARADRIAAAVQPRGDGVAPPPDNSLDAAFAAGFSS